MSHSINATQLFIIGSHASQTMSPNLWNPVFEALDNHWSYEPRDVPAHSPMQEIRNSLLSTRVIGANVTMPHKQWAAGIADERSEQVSLSGAANLLIRQGGKLHAYNTDLIAVATKLATRMHDHVVFLGAGGAARAALVALKEHIGTVTIADRDPEAANQLLSLATRMGVRGKGVDWSRAAQATAQASLVINATPIGKHAEDGAAWGTAQLAPGTHIYDFVYSAHTTGTIKAAIEQGLEYSDGWEHLLLQAEAMVPLLGLPEQSKTQLQQSLQRIRASATITERKA